MKKIWLAGGVIFFAALAWYFWPQGEESARGGAVPVSVVKSYRQEVFDHVEALGTAHANEAITVTATASETISEILFTDGQKVTKGDIIARLEQR